jgi:tRNA pseudouridine55 synthase
MFGFVSLNKSARISSRTALDKIAHPLRRCKVGHAGTLDPLATGVLVACIGPATRLVRYVQQMPKSYRALFRLGYESDTEDIDGELVCVDPAPTVGRTEIENVLPHFMGTIWQRPPAFSALKVGGKRAYRLARAGKALELAPRQIDIYRLQLTGLHDGYFELEIECGSGTYVRSLGRDIAEALGTKAVMSRLERTAIGCFGIENSIAIEADSVLEPNFLCASLISPSNVLQQGLKMAQVELSDNEIADLRHGRSLKLAPQVMAALGKACSSGILAVDREQKLMAVLKVPSIDQQTAEISLSFVHYWDQQA